MGWSNVQFQLIFVRLGRWINGLARAITVKGDEAPIGNLQKAIDIFAHMNTRRYPLSAPVSCRGASRRPNNTGLSKTKKKFKQTPYKSRTMMDTVFLEQKRCSLG